MRISEKRVLEWWEAPGIEGREAFDEEIVFLNNRAETLGLPRWAVRVRDLMPRWGFEPCAHRFFDGLEQVIGMIGAGKPGSHLGSCGDVPLSVHMRLQALGQEFLAWAGGKEAAELGPLLGRRTPARVEAARAVGQALTTFGQGWVATDAVLEFWTEQAVYALTKNLVDGEEAPLPRLLRHACAYNVLSNVRRLAQAIGAEGTPEIRVCQEALRELPTLAPERLEQLWVVLQALVRWLKKERPQDAVQSHLYIQVGERDPVREWLVASLYKSLKLWQVHIDRLLGQKHRLFSLI